MFFFGKIRNNEFGQSIFVDEQIDEPTFIYGRLNRGLVLLGFQILSDVQHDHFVA